jgi:hypothetical protein
VRNGHTEPAFADVVVPPTPERWARGDVARAKHQVQDSAGRPGAPFIAIDLLSKLFRDQRITDDELKAGYRFRGDFTYGHLDALRAADVSRGRVDGARFRRDFGISIYEARRRAMDAIDVLGGIASPVGSCVRHVVGAGETLKLWATSRYTTRQVSENAASGCYSPRSESWSPITPDENSFVGADLSLQRL